jgi:hypothetical protein
MEMKDLEDWLEFKPWLTDRNGEIYVLAASEGLISRLNIVPFSPVLTTNLPNETQDKSEAEVHI